ncbi:uncharacterized protein C8Q71DRAFT_392962 [Rhodofomes roseus]|uniref:Transmembrane protein n=1 Tax=Rhodofomes roseus TaxID=34475 RepID=A0ABQ8JZS4_9APHY|nr:uncharacterized protein C8Q71DRAFT_392962 [Rhodofomes roseus]KAH9829887.1 hypothetical protein C8Q71DRAFT_392962 [Rhodofomes roseus]
MNMAHTVAIIAVTIISRASVITSDIVVLSVTWWQLCGTLRLSGNRRNRSALARLLLRDSTAYFILFLLLNIAQITSQLTLGYQFNPIPAFLSPMTCIVISRLILSLRRFSFTTRPLMHDGSTTTVPTVDVQDPVHRQYLSTIMFRPDALSQCGNDRPISPRPQRPPRRGSEDVAERGPSEESDDVLDEAEDANDIEMVDVHVNESHRPGELR